MQWDTIRGLRYEGESGCTYLDVETDGTKDLERKAVVTENAGG